MADVADQIRRLSKSLVKQFVSQAEKVSDLIVKWPGPPNPPKKELIRILEQVRGMVNKRIDQLQRRIAGKNKTLLPGSRSKKKSAA